MALRLLLTFVCLGVVRSENGVFTQERFSEESAVSSLNDLLHQFLSKYDPYHVDKKDFDLELEEVTAKGYVENLDISGASGLTVEALAVVPVDGQVAVNLSLPSISVTGQYYVRGKISKDGLSLPVEGLGDISGGFQKLELQTQIDVSISNLGQILLDDFTLSWDMSDIQLQLDGLYGGTALGKMINKIIHDVLPRLVLKTYHTKITTLITTTVTEKGGDYLKSLHQDNGEPGPWEDASSPTKHAVARNEAAPSVLRLQLQDTAEQRAGGDGERDVPVDVQVAVDSDHQQGRLFSLFGKVFGQSGEGLKVKLDGHPSFYPHGVLSADSFEPEDSVDLEDSPQPEGSLDPEDSVDPEDSLQPEDIRIEIPDGGEEQHLRLLSMFGMMGQDSKGLKVELKGAPRFYPRGALSAVDLDSEDRDGQLVEDGGEDKKDVRETGFNILTAETKFYPRGALAHSDQ